MNRYLVQYLSQSGKWRDCADVDGCTAVYETYAAARQFQEAAETHTSDVRVVTLHGELSEDGE